VTPANCLFLFFCRILSKERLLNVLPTKNLGRYRQLGYYYYSIQTKQSIQNQLNSAIIAHLQTIIKINEIQNFQTCLRADFESVTYLVIISKVPCGIRM